MRSILLLGLFVAGCSGEPAIGVASDDATAAVLMFSVTAPYHASGTVMAGNDGFAYSVLPSSPLASDPWQFLFCYQADCLTMTQPLQFIPSGEIRIPVESNLNLVASGNIQCSSWNLHSTVSWYDATPLYWHIAINAICSDGTFSVQGEWMRVQ